MADNKNMWNALATAVINAVTSRTELLKAALDPRRDLDTECGYITNPTITDYNDLYEREGIARRVVHIIPDECWQVRPLVYETDDPDETEFERRWKELVEKFDLYAVMARADGLSGIGRFGVILFGFDDGKELSEPVESAKDLLYLRVFDESVITIDTIVTDPKNERYGLPEYYKISFSNSVSDGQSSSTTHRVHYTRILHIADNRRMSDVYGTSRLRPVFNRLQDLRKLLGGSAEMFWQGAFPGISFEVDPRLLESGNVELDTDSLKEEMQNYVNGLQRYLSLVGVNAKSLSPQIADPSHHIEQQLKAIAISIGVPYRIFIGTEEARLAGAQDAEAWAKRVMNRQNNYLTPHILRPFIQRLIDVGVLPQPSAIQIEWPDMLAPSDKDKAELAKITTEALKTYVQGDVETVMPLEIYLSDVLGFTQEQIDAILQGLTIEMQKESEDVETEAETETTSSEAE